MQHNNERAGGGSYDVQQQKPLRLTHSERPAGASLLSAEAATVSPTPLTTEAAAISHGRTTQRREQQLFIPRGMRERLQQQQQRHRKLIGEGERFCSADEDAAAADELPDATTATDAYCVHHVEEPLDYLLQHHRERGRRSRVTDYSKPLAARVSGMHADRVEEEEQQREQQHKQLLEQHSQGRPNAVTIVRPQQQRFVRLEQAQRLYHMFCSSAGQPTGGEQQQLQHQEEVPHHSSRREPREKEDEPATAVAAGGFEEDGVAAAAKIAAHAGCLAGRQLLGRLWQQHHRLVKELQLLLQESQSSIARVREKQQLLSSVTALQQQQHHVHQTGGGAAALHAQQQQWLQRQRLTALQQEEEDMQLHVVELEAELLSRIDEYISFYSSLHNRIANALPTASPFSPHISRFRQEHQQQQQKRDIGAAEGECGAFDAGDEDAERKQERVVWQQQHQQEVLLRTRCRDHLLCTVATLLGDLQRYRELLDPLAAPPAALPAATSSSNGSKPAAVVLPLACLGTVARRNVSASSFSDCECSSDSVVSARGVARRLQESGPSAQRDQAAPGVQECMRHRHNRDHGSSNSRALISLLLLEKGAYPPPPALREAFNHYFSAVRSFSLDGLVYNQLANLCMRLQTHAKNMRQHVLHQQVVQLRQFGSMPAALSTATAKAHSSCCFPVVIHALTAIFWCIRSQLCAFSVPSSTNSLRVLLQRCSSTSADELSQQQRQLHIMVAEEKRRQQNVLTQETTRNRSHFLSACQCHMEPLGEFTHHLCGLLQQLFFSEEDSTVSAKTATAAVTVDFPAAVTVDFPTAVAPIDLFLNDDPAATAKAAASATAANNCMQSLQRLLVEWLSPEMFSNSRCPTEQHLLIQHQLLQQKLQQQHAALLLALLCTLCLALYAAGSAQQMQRRVEEQYRPKRHRLRQQQLLLHQKESGCTLLREEKEDEQRESHQRQQQQQQQYQQQQTGGASSSNNCKAVVDRTLAVYALVPRSLRQILSCFGSQAVQLQMYQQQQEAQQRMQEQQQGGALAVSSVLFEGAKASIDGEDKVAGGGVSASPTTTHSQMQSALQHKDACMHGASVVRFKKSTLLLAVKFGCNFATLALGRAIAFAHQLQLLALQNGLPSLRWLCNHTKEKISSSFSAVERQKHKATIAALSALLGAVCPFLVLLRSHHELFFSNAIPSIVSLRQHLAVLACALLPPPSLKKEEQQEQQTLQRNLLQQPLPEDLLLQGLLNVPLVFPPEAPYTTTTTTSRCSANTQSTRFSTTTATSNNSSSTFLPNSTNMRSSRSVEGKKKLGGAVVLEEEAPGAAVQKDAENLNKKGALASAVVSAASAVVSADVSAASAVSASCFSSSSALQDNSRQAVGVDSNRAVCAGASPSIEAPTACMANPLIEDKFKQVIENNGQNLIVAKAVVCSGENQATQATKTQITHTTATVAKIETLHASTAIPTPKPRESATVVEEALETAIITTTGEVERTVEEAATINVEEKARATNIETTTAAVVEERDWIGMRAPHTERMMAADEKRETFATEKSLRASEVEEKDQKKEERCAAGTTQVAAPVVTEAKSAGAVVVATTTTGVLFVEQGSRKAHDDNSADEEDEDEAEELLLLNRPIFRTHGTPQRQQQQQQPEALVQQQHQQLPFFSNCLEQLPLQQPTQETLHQTQEKITPNEHQKPNQQKQQQLVEDQQQETQQQQKQKQQNQTQQNQTQQNQTQTVQVNEFGEVIFCTQGEEVDSGGGELGVCRSSLAQEKAGEQASSSEVGEMVSIAQGTKQISKKGERRLASTQAAGECTSLGGPGAVQKSAKAATRASVFAEEATTAAENEVGKKKMESVVCRFHRKSRYSLFEIRCARIASLSSDTPECMRLQKQKLLRQQQQHMQRKMLNHQASPQPLELRDPALAATAYYEEGEEKLCSSVPSSPQSLATLALLAQIRQQQLLQQQQQRDFDSEPQIHEQPQQRQQKQQQEQQPEGAEPVGPLQRQSSGLLRLNWQQAMLYQHQLHLLQERQSIPQQPLSTTGSVPGGRAVFVQQQTGGGGEAALQSVQESCLQRQITAEKETEEEQGCRQQQPQQQTKRRPPRGVVPAAALMGKKASMQSHLHHHHSRGGSSGGSSGGGVGVVLRGSGAATSANSEYCKIALQHPVIKDSEEATATGEENMASSAGKHPAMPVRKGGGSNRAAAAGGGRNFRLGGGNTALQQQQHQQAMQPQQHSQAFGSSSSSSNTSGRHLFDVAVALQQGAAARVRGAAAAVNREEGVGRLVVIDGSNVAMRHGQSRTGGQEKQFSSSGVKIVANFYLDRGYNVRIVLPDYLLNYREVGAAKRMSVMTFSPKEQRVSHIPDSVFQLRDLMRQKLVISTPPQDYDDSYTIMYAMTHDGCIVTNDRYIDFLKSTSQQHVANQWLRTHLISFTFAGDEFIPNPDFRWPPPAHLDANLALLSSSAHTSSSSVVPNLSVDVGEETGATAVVSASTSAAVPACNSNSSTNTSELPLLPLGAPDKPTDIKKTTRVVAGTRAGRKNEQAAGDGAVVRRRRNKSCSSNSSDNEHELGEVGRSGHRGSTSSNLSSAAVDEKKGRREFTRKKSSMQRETGNDSSSSEKSAEVPLGTRVKPRKVKESTKRQESGYG